MFGRKKDEDKPVDDLLDEDTVDDLDEDGVADEDVDELDSEDDVVERDEWSELDESRDWRDDGPFDIDEVDLEDDDVARLNLGSLILTPTEGMELQLQMNPQTNEVQTVLVMLGDSGMEVALFAAPASGGVKAQVRRDIIEGTRSEGGAAEIAPGPFGPEVRRMVPVTLPDGQEGTHISRTWLAEGPRWLLRGVLMGEACLDASDRQQAYPFIEFFKNIVVVRGDRPRPAGDVIPMTLPDDVQPQ